MRVQATSPRISAFYEKRWATLQKQVQCLNATRLEEKFFPVFHEFVKVEEHAGGDVSFLA